MVIIYKFIQDLILVKFKLDFCAVCPEFVKVIVFSCLWVENVYDYCFVVQENPVFAFVAFYACRFDFQFFFNILPPEGDKLLILSFLNYVQTTKFCRKRQA